MVYSNPRTQPWVSDILGFQIPSIFVNVVFVLKGLSAVLNLSVHEGISWLSTEMHSSGSQTQYSLFQIATELHLRLLLYAVNYVGSSGI